MAVYHLGCRLVAEPTRPNPPARVAKWQQACALSTCDRMIWKGDMISCTRDNENGHRKGSKETIPAPPADEPEPATFREPFPMTPPPSLAGYVTRESLECARRELDVTRRELDTARAENDKLHSVIVGIRNALMLVSQ